MLTMTVLAAVLTVVCLSTVCPLSVRCLSVVRFLGFVRGDRVIAKRSIVWEHITSQLGLGWGESVSRSVETWVSESSCRGVIQRVELSRRESASRSVETWVSESSCRGVSQ